MSASTPLMLCIPTARAPTMASNKVRSPRVDEGRGKEGERSSLRPVQSWLVSNLPPNLPQCLRNAPSVKMLIVTSLCVEVDSKSTLSRPHLV